MKKQPKKTQHRGMGAFGPKPKSQTTGINYLFSIAIDDYVNFPKLHNCVKDAKDIVALLTRDYQFEPEHVYAIYNEEATTDTIFQHFEMLAKKIRPIDNLVIYFAGHGMYKEVFKEGYWIPVNATDQRTSQFIPNSEIKTMLTAINAKHTFLIVDSCFSGSLFARGTTRSIADRVERFPSRWGLTSGRSEIVADGTPGVNSPFASSILYLLKNNTKQLGVQELCTHVIESVISNAIQTPIGEPLTIPGHQGGQFIFRLKKDEVRDWADTQKANDIKAYATFVALYPDGKHYEEAASKLMFLKEEKLWQEVKDKNTIKGYIIYKNKYPSGKYVDQAIELIEDLEDDRDWKIACRKNRISAYLKYKRNYPDGKHLAAAKEKIAALNQKKPARQATLETIHPPTNVTTNTPEKPNTTINSLFAATTSEEKTSYGHQPTPGKKYSTSRLIAFGLPLLVVGIFIISKFFSPSFGEKKGSVAADETLNQEVPISSETESLSKEIPEATTTTEALSTAERGVDPISQNTSTNEATKKEIQTAKKPAVEKKEKVKTNNQQKNPPQNNSRNTTTETPKVEAPTKPAIPAAVNALERSMVKIGKGSFPMGSETLSDAPIHVVMISSSFSISKTEVTQELWQAVMGYNPSHQKNCAQCPVEYVSFYEVGEFLQKLRALTGKRYRLPTEAEWEFAAVAGTKNDLNYQNPDRLPRIAYYRRNAQSPKIVGQKAPNQAGLHDMLGNVREWCLDWYDENFYTDNATDPLNKRKGLAASRVVRGGSFLSEEEKCSVYYRSAMAPDQRKKDIGFRVVLD
ncbi:MAG: SUMF1/EgtB/PvdO family nonheme iron enzyme [Bacteroidota bacterium]